MLIWDLGHLGLTPSPDLLGQDAEPPAISKMNVEMSSNLPFGAVSKTLKKNPTKQLRQWVNINNSKRGVEMDV